MIGVNQGAVLNALADAHAYFRSRVDASWVPDHLNRRNLYAQMRPAGVGYAPAGWDHTLRHLRGLGYSDATLEAAGLARRASTGRLIDPFRDRLIVPLRDRNRVLVGFIGRAGPAAGDQMPKYLNSPQTGVFSKHNLLHGLGEDLDEIHRGAMPVVVEGPMDRLAIRQGARHLSVVGVAPCGTALTANQANALLAEVGPCRPIAVAFDPDPGGRSATVRAWEVLTDAGARNLLQVPLLDGRDPAELVRIGRDNLLRDAIVDNRPLAMVVADQRIAAIGVTRLNPWQRRLVMAKDVVSRDLKRVPSDLVGAYVAHLAQRLDLAPEVITAVATEAVAIRPPAGGRSTSRGAR